MLASGSGFAPKRKQIRELDDLEKKELLKRGAITRADTDVERVKGLGADAYVQIGWMRVWKHTVGRGSKGVVLCLCVACV